MSDALERIRFDDWGIIRSATGQMPKGEYVRADIVNRYREALEKVLSEYSSFRAEMGQAGWTLYMVEAHRALNPEADDE